MRSAFNLLVFPNSIFSPFFYVKGLCALRRNKNLEITIIIIIDQNKGEMKNGTSLENKIFTMSWFKVDKHQWNDFSSESDSWIWIEVESITNYDITICGIEMMNE